MNKNTLLDQNYICPIGADVGQIALEVACQEVLGVSGLGRRFKENLDQALRNKKLKKIAWGVGLWQRVSRLQSIRTDFVHRNPTQDILFAETILAEETIEIVRAAINDIYSRAGKPPPAWVQDDHDPGWSASTEATFSATLTGIHAGADKDGPDTIRVCYVVNGIEHTHTLHPPGTDPAPFLAELEASLNVPAQALRAYRGEELLVERTLTMRGN